tara:strand:+ start:125 stop:466 length:342 start_codon:yes stop_codon:yes gene_type:complete
MYKEYLQKLENLKGSKRIELSVAGDIQKQIANIKTERKNVSTATKAFQKAADDALDAREAGVDVFQRAMAIREDAIEGAKALGMKPEDIKGYKTLDDTVDLLWKEYQALLKMI